MVLIFLVSGKVSSGCDGSLAVGVNSLTFQELPYVLPLSLQPGSKMVSSAKAAVPTVSDQAAAMQLSQCAKNLATSLAELRTASQKASGPLVTAVSSLGMVLDFLPACITRVLPGPEHCWAYFLSMYLHDH